MRATSSWLAASFALGLLVGDRWPAAAPCAFAVSLGACTGSSLLRRRPAACIAAACLATAGAGAGLMGRRVERAGSQLQSLTPAALLEGRVAEVERHAGATRIDLGDVAWVSPPLAGARRAQLWLEPAAPPPPLGSRIRAAARSRPLASGPSNPGGGDPARRLARRGVGASLRAVDPLLVHVVEPAAFAPARSIAAARRRGADRLRAVGRGGALLAALALGDPAGLPERDRRAWAALGIAHLLAVSGLHLALVAGGAYALAARGLARCTRWAAHADTRRGALGVALAAAAAYAALSGLATPAVRSLVMVTALAAAVSMRRAPPSAHALASAALVVMVLDPAALFAPGAQLSFAAAFALVLAPTSSAERSEGRRLERALAAAVSTAACATLATAPIAAFHFGAAPPLAGLANLAAVPVTAALLIPLAFVTSAAALLAPDAVPAEAFALPARLAETALDAALALSCWAPRVAPHPPGVAAWMACGFAACIGLRTRRLGARVSCAFAAQAALAFLPPSAIEPSGPRVVFLDVGHGDAALVQSGGFSLLVDAGAVSPDGWDAGSRVVVPALAALGVRHLDALAISHADLDHQGGARAVLAVFPCAELWLPHGASREAAFTALLEAAREHDVRVREIGAGDAPILRDRLRVAPLWPPRAAQALSDNDRSLVLHVVVDGLAVSLLGDLEAAGERALLASGGALRSDVVKLAHHGSRSSSTSALLEAARPRLAIASAPLHGRFGWPHPEVRARLAERGIALGWTGRDGAVIVRAGAQPCARRWRASEECIPLAGPP